MPIITLEPGGARPPTPTEQSHIRTAIGVATLTVPFGSPAPSGSTPAAQSIGQWTRHGTSDPAVWDWYQWNGVEWRFVRRDGVSGSGGAAAPTDLGSISSNTLALNRQLNSAFTGQRSNGNPLVINPPINILDGQEVALDITAAAGDVELDFGNLIQMPSEARSLLPTLLVSSSTVRIVIGQMNGSAWLLRIDGPIS